jgi:hypothetical protein
MRSWTRASCSSFLASIRAAGEACGRWLSVELGRHHVSITPRRCLEDCGMTLLDLRELLEAIADNQPPT